MAAVATRIFIMGILGHALFTLPARAEAPAAKGPIILADVSLKPALDPIAAAWAAARGKTPSLVFDSSAALTKQVEAGAMVDVIILSDRKWMDELEAAALIDKHTRRRLIGDDLVLIAPAASKTTLKIMTGFPLSGFLGDGKLAVCAIETCAAGIFTKQSLEKLEVFPSVEPALLQSDDGRSAVLRVADGEASFGIVYASDAKAEPKVRVIDTFPASTHGPIAYPVALAKATKTPDAADFEAYMRSGEATRILLRQGYVVVK